MPIHHQVRLILKHTSFLPADDDVLTFAIGTTDDVQLNLNGLKEDFANFFNIPNAGTRRLGGYLQPCISRGNEAHTIEAYDMDGHLDGSPHGVPYAVDHFTITEKLTPNHACPAETAAVITLYAAGRETAPVEVANTRPKQRHTGHLYFGPLDGEAFSEIEGEYRLATVFTDELVIACDRLQNDLDAAWNATWCVWSRVDAVYRGINAVSIDNAPDTQRRRGVAATRASVGSVLNN